MRITITNVNGNVDGANVMLSTIAKDTINSLEEDGSKIQGVKLEEVSATYSVLPEGQDDYYVVSVDHGDLTEMLEVNYDLEDGVREDNEQLSLFSDGDREVLSGGISQRFETVDPVFDVEELEFLEEKVVDDLIVRNYQHPDGRIVVRVFQKDNKSTPERLIQEYSFEMNK